MRSVSSPRAVSIRIGSDGLGTQRAAQRQAVVARQHQVEDRPGRRRRRRARATSPGRHRRPWPAGRSSRGSGSAGCGFPHRRRRSGCGRCVRSSRPWLPLHPAAAWSGPVTTYHSMSRRRCDMGRDKTASARHNLTKQAFNEVRCESIFDNAAAPDNTPAPPPTQHPPEGTQRHEDLDPDHRHGHAPPSPSGLAASSSPNRVKDTWAAWARGAAGWPDGPDGHRHGHGYGHARRRARWHARHGGVPPTSPPRLATREDRTGQITAASGSLPGSSSKASCASTRRRPPGHACQPCRPACRIRRRPPRSDHAAQREAMMKAARKANQGRSAMPRARRCTPC
jgi:hypothetical protein